MVCHNGNSLVCLSVIQPEVGEVIYLRIRLWISAR